MSICNSCKEKYTSCIEQDPCGCPIKDLSTDCVKYTGDTLSCSGITVPDTLTNIIKKLDEFICDKYDNLTVGNIVNIGTGAKFFKQINNIGNQELKTLTSVDSSVSITENTNEIDLSVTNQVSINSPDGSITPTEISPNNFNLVANFPASNTLNITSDDNSVTVDDTTTPGTVDLSVDTTKTTITSSSITVTGPTNNNYNIEAPTQQQADVIEQNIASPSFIQNQNPTKTVSSNYTLTSADNNYVIVVDSELAPRTINVDANSLPTDNFFIGFIQKGTNNVTFTGGIDTIPDGYTNIIFGNGHNAAIEIIGNNIFLLGSLKQ